MQIFRMCSCENCFFLSHFWTLGIQGMMPRRNLFQLFLAMSFGLQHPCPNLLSERARGHYSTRLRRERYVRVHWGRYRRGCWGVLEHPQYLGFLLVNDGLSTPKNFAYYCQHPQYENHNALTGCTLFPTLYLSLWRMLKMTKITFAWVTFEKIL